MKNLENFGVQELDAREIRETDGGIIPLLIIAVDLFIMSAYSGYLYEAWKSK
tara:strand:- start:719 stop:874 length:156 start_codon:yes stop_codon:yes gene_type:complete